MLEDRLVNAFALLFGSGFGIVVLQAVADAIPRRKRRIPLLEIVESLRTDRRHLESFCVPTFGLFDIRGRRRRLIRIADYLFDEFVVESSVFLVETESRIPCHYLDSFLVFFFLPSRAFRFSAVCRMSRFVYCLPRLLK